MSTRDDVLGMFPDGEFFGINTIGVCAGELTPVFLERLEGCGP